MTRHNGIIANGWTRTTVKPGDVITGTGYQFADGQKIIRLERVVLADGREIRVYGRWAASLARRIIQRRASSGS